MSKHTQLPAIATSSETEQTVGGIYKVIKEFNARLDDELNLRLGDKIEVISDDKEYNDGWFIGKSLSTGESGLYPKAFTQFIPSLSKPTLLRSRSRRIGSPSSSSHNSPITSHHNNANPATQPPVIPTPSIHISNDSPDSSFETNMYGHSSQQDDDEGSVVDIDDDTALNNIDKALEELRTEASSSENSTKPIVTSSNSTNNLPQTPVLSKEKNVIQQENTSSKTNEDILDPKYVESWTPEQVTSYFAYLGFDMKSSGQFARHKITGSILLELELAYLKELDITSFGTRFEMFKEIEALKEFAKESKTRELINNNNLSNNNNKTKSSLLDPAPELTIDKKMSDNFDSFTKPLERGHSRKKSQSLDNIPESIHNDFLDFSSAPNGHTASAAATAAAAAATAAATKRNSLKPSTSQSKRNTLKPNLPELPPPLESQFISPRKAPNPPNYPSPIQATLNTPDATSKRNSSSNHHSRKPSYEINSNFFNKNLSRHSSFYDTSKRPVSSIYYDSHHSRNSSFGGSNTNKNSYIHSHRRSNSEVSNYQDSKSKRNSSVFAFLTGNNHNAGAGNISPKRNSMIIQHAHDFNHSKNESLSEYSTPVLSADKRRSVSQKDAKSSVEPSPKVEKRSVSEAVKAKTLRNLSTSKSSSNKKETTSAFMEGIRNINPKEASKDADCSGWMSKRGGIAVGSWKNRYFTLHGTRLSYFTSLSDKRERGLIDITSHKVLPAKEDDKLLSLYAASLGHGKFCFKLVPPAPGSKKGLTFTQQKVHYFAVDTKDEMRNWMAALIKATIDIDESVPILSSCATPTVSLQKAQNMLSEARETAKAKEEFNRQQILLHQQEQENAVPPFLKPTTASDLSSASPDSNSFDSSHHQAAHSPNTTVNTADRATPVMPETKAFYSPYDNTAVSNSGHSPISYKTPTTEYPRSPMASVTPSSGLKNAPGARADSTRITSVSSSVYHTDNKI